MDVPADTNAWLHIVNRGARQLPIFGDPADCRSFLALLRDWSTVTDVEVHAFALMPNHFHLLTRSPAEAAAQLMQGVSSIYTRRFNRKYAYDGPLLKGRYRRTRISSDAQLLAAVRYIHGNPFASRGTHRMLGTHRWTSHGIYADGTADPDWVRTDAVLEMTGGQGGFRELMATLPAITDPLVPKRLQTHLSSLRDIEQAVGIDAPAELQAVRSGGRGIRSRQRMTSVLLATEYGDADPRTIADRYGYSSIGSVRSAVSRARRLAVDDPSFAEELGRARACVIRGNAA